jgi:hypothetical protein
MTALGGKDISENTHKEDATGGQVDSIVAGTNVTVNSADPANPVVSSTAAGSPTTTLGDLIKRGASADERLPIGNALEVLQVNAGGTDLEFATAAASTPTTTQGDIIQRGASADERLAIGTALQVLQVNAGATALEYVEPSAGGGVTINGGKFAPPLAADFPTWINQEAGTITDDPFAGMALYDGTTDTNTDNIISRVKPMPSGSWTATCKISVLLQKVNFNSVGFVMRDSATNRQIVFNTQYNGGYKISISKFNNNTFSSSILSGILFTESVEWLRVEDDTVDFKFSVSHDGVNFTQIASEGRTVFLASPDQIGFNINPESAAPVGITVSYYDDKDTPAQITAPTVAAGFQGALVSHSATHTVNGFLILPFDTEEYDIGGWHESVTNPSRFTVPAGVAFVRLTMNVKDASSVTGQLNVTLAKNGSSTFVGGTTNEVETAGGDGVNASSPVLAVVEGDYFELEVFTSSSRTTDTIKTNFSIEKVG